jgi:hypothetical protein
MGDVLALLSERFWVDVEAGRNAVAKAPRAGNSEVYATAVELYSLGLLSGGRYEETGEGDREGGVRPCPHVREHWGAPCQSRRFASVAERSGAAADLSQWTLQRQCQSTPALSQPRCGLGNVQGTRPAYRSPHPRRERRHR